MKNDKRRLLVWMVRMSVAALAFCILTHSGLSPILSVLAILYRKTIIILGILAVGMAYCAHTIMN